MLGKILEVSTVARGSYATVDHAVGATTLYVQDGSDFDDAGTLTVLDGTGAEVPVTYTRVDDVLTVEPLPVAVGEDAPVLVAPAASDMVAQVLVDPVGTEGDTEPVEAVVQHSLRAFLADGIRRTPDVQETAVVELVDGVWTVTDVPGVAPTVLAAALPPLEVGPDGLAPAASPAPSVVGTVGALLASWLPVVNHDPLTYEVHLSATSGFTPSAATLARETAGGSAALSALPDGSPLAYGTTYYVRVVAKDADGAAPASVEASGQMRPAGQEDISAAYAYLGKLYAHQILSGEVTAELVLSGAIKTALVGARVEMDATGVRVYAPDGTVATALGADRNLFSGDVEAAGLVVRERMEIQPGATASVAAGGSLVLQAGVQAPVNAPQVTHWWPTIATLTDADGAVLSDVFVSALGSGYLTVTRSGVVREHDSTGACTATVTNLSADWQGPYGLEEGPIDSAGTTLGGVKAGGYYVLLVQWRDGTRHLYRWAASGGNALQSVSVPAYQAIGVTEDASAVLCAYHVSSKVTVVERSASTLAIIKTVTNAVAATSTSPVAAVARQTPTLYVTGVAGAGMLRFTDSTGADRSEFEVAQASSVLAGYGYNGSVYWSAVGEGRIVAHDGTDWSGAWRVYRDFAFTWRKGTAETLPGPRQKVYALKGARTRITTTPIPPGGTIDGVGVYSALSGGTLRLQGTSATHVVDVQTLSDSSAAAPTGNTFPDAVPAVIKSLDGTMAIDAMGGVKLVPARFRGYPIAARIDMNGSDTAALTASNYKSIPVKTIRESTGEWTPAFSGDCLTMPYKAWVRIVLHASFNASTGGNRLIAIWKNPGATTLNSSSPPPTVTRLAESKFGPTTDTASDEVTFEGLVNEGDLIMFVARTTSSVSVGGQAYETWATVTIERILD